MVNGANLTSCGTNNIIKNVELINITFKHLDGVFFENVGQVLFGDSENVVIENCKFIGSKSDGISFGGDLHGNIGHNKNVIVRNCFFDGVNNENRNAITLSSVEDCLVENCLFKNFTRSDMPGAIDMETDSRTPWILKNITIRNNSFYNIGGSVAVISLVSFCSQDKLLVPIENITIENNYIDTTLHLQSGISISQIDTVITNNTINNNIKILNNTIKNCIYRGISIQGIKDITISGNIIKKCKKGNAIGYIRDLEICKDVLIENNLFQQCGTDEGVGLIVFSCNRVDINNNKFIDCGKSDGTFGNSIAFWKGTDNNINDYLIIRNNYFSSPNKKITKNIDMDSRYITNTDTNIYQNNYLDEVSGNGFKYKITNEYYNNKTYYDFLNLPDSFPVGVSVQASYDGTNAPDNITYGTIVTSKPSSKTSERMMVCQWFYSGDESKNNIYYRIGDYSKNGWKGWKKISGVAL